MTERERILKLTDCYHCVGPGWAAILSMLHAELEVVCPQYEVLQVKEKFGTLRAYISPVLQSEGMVPSEKTAQAMAYSLEHRYEALSAHVCEVCGQLGDTRQNAQRWYKTLCAEHREQEGAGGT
jgi:hypothetical protein